MSRIRAFIASWPEPFRLIVRDIIEGALAGIATVVIVVPTNVGEAKDQAIVIAVAAIGAAVAVARRELLPYLTRWLLGLFTTPTDPA